MQSLEPSAVIPRVAKAPANSMRPQVQTNISVFLVTFLTFVFDTPSPAQGPSFCHLDQNMDQLKEAQKVRSSIPCGPYTRTSKPPPPSNPSAKREKRAPWGWASAGPHGPPRWRRGRGAGPRSRCRSPGEGSSPRGTPWHALRRALRRRGPKREAGERGGLHLKWG